VLDVGTRMTSGMFQVGDTWFRVEAYPTGASEDCKEHISIYLTTPSCSSTVQMLHEISILDVVRAHGNSQMIIAFVLRIFTSAYTL
jgi:hypothetical protein